MAKLAAKIFAPLEMAWGRTPVVWRWRKPRDDFEFIRVSVAKNFNPSWNRRFPRLSNLLYFYMLAVWPIRALCQSCANLAGTGAALKQQRGIGYLKQLVDQLYLAVRFKVEPEDYYRYHLYEPDNRHFAGSYLTTVIQNALFNLINGNVSNAFTEDKIEFNRLLENNGIPVVPTLDYLDFTTAESVPAADELQLPAQDFIAKPNFGMGGVDVLRFEITEPAQYRCSDSRVMSQQQVKELLIDLSSKEPYLLQPKLVNHPHIADLSPKGFSTARVITARLTDGSIKLIYAVFKMQSDEQVVDNFEMGGLASAVDPVTGELAAAYIKKSFDQPLLKHPSTGATIVGRKLPDWQRCAALLLDAHQLLPDYVFLGWDVGFTEAGPIIIETNVLWSPSLIQQPHGQPLGLGEFATISRQWLEKS